MDIREYGANMIYHANQILKMCNYAIIVNCINKNTYEINCMMDDLQYYITIENGEIFSTFNSKTIKCEPYSYKVYLEHMIDEILEYYNYPNTRVIYLEDGKKKTKLVYNNENTDKTENIHMLYQDMCTNGLQKVHIDLAKTNDIWPEFKNTIEHIYGICINE